MHPWAAVEVPRGLGTHGVAEDGAHVGALAQLADHAARRRARQALLVRSISQERSPRADAAHARREQAGPGALLGGGTSTSVGKGAGQVARGLTWYGGRSRGCGRL